MSCYPCSVSSFLYLLPQAQAPQESRNNENVIPAEAGMTFCKTGMTFCKTSINIYN